jgi:uncharacterized protein (DUF2062 family)/SAM-dependent methyltransferase
MSLRINVPSPNHAEPGEPLTARASPKHPGRLTGVVYRYRTEHNTPIRQALSVGLGLYIGASPFIGLHLALSLALGWLFGLNRFKVYLAAQISLPFIAPFLYALEIQVGTYLRSGRFLSASRLDEVRLQGLALDILVGSVVVGLALAIVGTLLTYSGSRGRRDNPEEGALVAAAAERYLLAGISSWEFARAKMRNDPVYLQVLKDGRLPQIGTLVDLGCGQGLMLSLMATAADEWRNGRWPATWPAPPTDLKLRGIETRPGVVKRARLALDGVATIDELDLSVSPVPDCEAVLIFDVLHLLSRDAQQRLLANVAEALPAGGLLIVRDADAAAGWKFQMVRFGNRFNSIWQARFSRKFCFDTLAGWTRRIEALGFDVEAVTRHDSGVFGNFLIQVRRVRESQPHTG